jgi:hypothetical protein
MRYHEIAQLNENASAGASGSANVATAVQPFFSSDPKETEKRSIYGKQPSQKAKKPAVIKRNK